jgi:caffeoyl-CoA O-methyltransferase
MAESEARVPTPQPERYIKQLVSHLGHRAQTELGPDGQGVIRLDVGYCTLTAAPGTLVLHATAEGAEGLARVQDVVARHLERFGTREGVQVQWSTPG